jgi:EAL domain-containing protein (putative c-di-GMP-specific phosphodiesterase class I)
MKCPLPSNTRTDLSFRIAFQPVINTNDDGSIFSFEALLRGPCGESAAFVLNQVHKRDSIRFDATCRRCAVRMMQTLAMPARVNVNVNPSAIFDSSLGLDDTIRAAQEIGFCEERLVFEILENKYVEDMKQLHRLLSSYKPKNILIALDDFGAGYNNLNSLLELQPDIIKLDMGLIRGIDKDARRRSLVLGLSSACNAMEITIIGEGVETRGEADALRNLGINLMQGHLFGMPVICDEICNFHRSVSGDQMLLRQAFRQARA